MPRRLFAIKLILTAGALTALVVVVEWQALLDAAHDARPGWALAALALLPANVGLEAYRWHRLVRRLAPHLRFRQSLAAVLSGYPLGLLTPGRVGDYVGRALYLRDVPRGPSAALTFAERMATLASCLIFGLAVLPSFLTMYAPAATLAWIAVLGLALVGAAALLILLIHPPLARTVLNTLLPFGRLKASIDTFENFNGRDAASLLTLSALRYGIFSTQFVLLVHAFAPETPWMSAYTGVLLIFFAKSAIPSITLGDLGIRESAAVFFLGAYGVAEAAAFNASLAVFGLNILLPALAGLVLLPRLRLVATPQDGPETDAVRGQTVASEA